MRTKSFYLLTMACVMAVVNVSSADIIRGINMDFVTIAHPGNSGDTRTYADDYGYPVASPYGCGSVGYNYRIGKYEVTNAQWNAFTTAAGVPTGNPSYAYNTNAYFTGSQQPTNYVSWYEAAQFCNYLTSGNKYSGAYKFDQRGNFLEIDRISSISTYGTTYIIPTEDEWYKAAYFKPDGSGYSLYANGTDTAPVAGVNSNYNNVVPWDITNGAQEQNGTFNMMGNVWEWNETLISGAYRGIRGGSYNSYDHYLSSSGWVPDYYRFAPYCGFDYLGFRVASVPEPSIILLLGFGGLMLRKRVLSKTA